MLLLGLFPELLAVRAVHCVLIKPLDDCKIFTVQELCLYRRIHLYVMNITPVRAPAFQAKLCSIFLR